MFNANEGRFYVIDANDFKAGTPHPDKDTSDQIKEWITYLENKQKKVQNGK